MSLQTNLFEIIEKIFSSELLPHNAIQLGLETGSEHSTLANNANITEILAQMLLHGTTILFGENSDLFTLNQPQINKLKQYFQSFGFDCSILIHNINIPYGMESSSTPSYHIVLNDENDEPAFDIVFKHHQCSENCT